MIKRILMMAAAFSALSVLVAACVHRASEPEELMLFDGSSLTGWIPLGDAQWQVEDGVLTAAAGTGEGFLVSSRTFHDYRLQVEFWVDDQVNSGVFVACADPSEITPFNCHEVNIWDHHPKQEFRTGAIVAKVSPPMAQVATVDQWNRYEIVAHDGRLTVTLNGVLTAEMPDPTNAEGHIAVQSANGGIVRFRRISLQPLP